MEMMKTMTNDEDVALSVAQVQEKCFSIIAYVGEAKSCFMEALQLAKSGDYDGSRSKMSEGSDCYNKGHEVHGELIAREATACDVPVSLFLIHAEAILMDAESCKGYVSEFIDLHRELSSLKKEMPASEKGA